MIPLSSFLQSRAWEEFQRAVGRRTWRLDGALVIRHDLHGGFNYLYAPHPDIHSDFFSAAEELAADEKSIFLKIDPIAPLVIPKTRYQIRDTRSLQPRETIIIDLALPEDALLSAMHEKTRYNIRLAERKGVTVRRVSGVVSAADFDAFWHLMEETAARDGFRLHAREYYQKLLTIYSDEFSNELVLVRYRDETIAAAIINFYRGSTSIKEAGGEATYLHGASSSTHRAAMAPHLLHWRIMQDAKERGCGTYDLWGIDERRWPGLTRFKKGFGGRVLVRPASIDMIYRAGGYAGYTLWKRFFGR